MAPSYVLCSVASISYRKTTSERSLKENICVYSTWLLIYTNFVIDHYFIYSGTITRVETIDDF